MLKEKQEHQEIRKNFDKYFDGVFKYAVHVAAAVGTEPTAPVNNPTSVQRNFNVGKASANVRLTILYRPLANVRLT